VSKRFLHLLAVLAVAGGAGAAPPSKIVHRPPTVATMGQPLPIALTLAAGPGPQSADGISVTLHCRARGEDRYTAVPLFTRGAGRFEGEIPALHTRSLSVAYYLEIAGPDGAWSVSLGSADEPIDVGLLAPQRAGDRVSPAAKVALMAAVALGLSAALWLRERRQKNTVLDQIFWARTLLPLVHLKGSRLSAELTRLSRQTLQHPVSGPLVFPRVTLLQRLAEVRAVDLDSLEESRDRLPGR